MPCEIFFVDSVIGETEFPERGTFCKRFTDFNVTFGTEEIKD